MSFADKPPTNHLIVLLDSNALFVPLQLKIDIFEEMESLLERRVEPVLLSPILNEIKKLSRRGTSKTQKNAACALKMAGRCKTARIDEKTMPPDDALIKVASEWQCPVFTNDRALRRKLRDINVPVIYVRQKSRLAIEGSL